MTDKPQRRRYQDSLRSLFVVMTLVAIACSFYATTRPINRVKPLPFDEIIETRWRRGKVLAGPEIDGPFRVPGVHYSSITHPICVQRLKGKRQFPAVDGHYYIMLTLENAAGKRTNVVLLYPVSASGQNLP